MRLQIQEPVQHRPAPETRVETALAYRDRTNMRLSTDETGLHVYDKPDARHHHCKTGRGSSPAVSRHAGNDFAMPEAHPENRSGTPALRDQCVARPEVE